MAERNEYQFVIDGFSPLTLSMKRLKEYMDDLVELFANEDDIHFLRVEEGSASPCIWVDRSAETKVERRLIAVKSGDASEQALAAYSQLNEKLAEDDTEAVLKRLGKTVLKFPGRNLQTDPEVGPISEFGEISGEIIQIGGRDETISVYIRTHESIHICTASRELGRRLAPHLFTGVIRVVGQARWMRKSDATWKLVRFTISDFTPLRTDALSDVVKSLRSIKSEEIDKSGDPTALLERIRGNGGG